MTTLLLLTILLVTPGGQVENQDPSRVAAEVREAERAFAKTMTDRDHAAFVGFLAEDVVFLGSDRVLRGRTAVAEGWSGYFRGPTAPFTWEPERVEVTGSGSLAISTGPVRDPEGRRIGTFTSTWRRESDGRWRVVFDSGCPSPEPAAARLADHARALLHAHEAVLTAHRAGDVAAWMEVEADALLVGSRGRISTPEAGARRRARESYFASTQFSSYRDLRDPVVRVSADGTLGWVVAEVEVKGSRRMPDGTTEAFDDVWVWVELYEKQAGRWQMVGNVSTDRQLR